MSIGNNVVIQGIYSGIEESLNTILDARAAELGDLLRLQQETVKSMVHKKQLLLIQLEEETALKNTEKVINTLNEEFEKEKTKLDNELNELKEVIFRSIMNETNPEKQKNMSTFLIEYIQKHKEYVRLTRNGLSIAEQQREEYGLFSNIISGFVNKFYDNFDFLTDRLKIIMNKLNSYLSKKLNTEVDVEYGLDELILERNSTRSSSIKTVSTVATVATDETGKLLDNAFNPTMAAITTLELIRDRLIDITKNLPKNFLKFATTGIGSPSENSSNGSRSIFLKKGAPLRYHSGLTESQGSTSTIDSDALSSIESQSDVNFLGNNQSFYQPSQELPLPEGLKLRRMSSAPLVEQVPIILSQKTDPNLFTRRRKFAPGKVLGKNTRFERYNNPLGKPRSKKGSPKVRTRANSVGGKKHRRRTTHRKKRIN